MAKDKFKNRITESERLQLIALITLGKDYSRKVEDCMQAMNKLMEDEEFHYTIISEMVYEYDTPLNVNDLDKLLEEFGIKVVK